MTALPIATISLVANRMKRAVAPRSDRAILRRSLRVMAALLVGAAVVAGSSGVSQAADITAMDWEAALRAAPPGSVVTIAPGTYPRQTLDLGDKCGPGGQALWVVAADRENVHVQGIDLRGSCINLYGFRVDGWVFPHDGIKVNIGSDHIGIYFNVIDGSAGKVCDNEGSGRGIHINSTPDQRMDKTQWNHDIVIHGNIIVAPPDDGLDLYGARDVMVRSNTIMSAVTNDGIDPITGAICDFTTNHNDLLQMERVENVVIDDNVFVGDPRDVHCCGELTGPDHVIIASDGVLGNTATGISITGNTVYGWKRGVPLNFAGVGVVVDTIADNTIRCSNPTSTGSGILPNSGATVVTQARNTFSEEC